MRDIFLSHRSLNKKIVRQLAADIEVEKFQGRSLTTWLDEAEIRPGQSAVQMINDGLESSRFIGLVMTPEYFRSDSGWTDAEWHSALFVDPDNRKGRILPILAADCPYIPILLRHLNPLDMRGNKYEEGLQQLLRVLREEPLPRPITIRGQLVNPGGRIDRATLIAERAVPQADPDPFPEKLYCNLLPVEKLPQYVYVAPISRRLFKRRPDGTEVIPSKQHIKDAIRLAQEEANVEHPFVPAFRVHEGMIVTFHDLESIDGPFASVIEEDADVEPILIPQFVRDEDDRRLVISLLHMAIDRHASRVGLTIDETKHRRFFFPPKDSGSNIITWVPKKRRTSRTVAKPCIKDDKVMFWRHLGAYLTVFYLANKFYLRIRPTWVITEDGRQVRGGPDVGRLITRWTGPERNLHILYHVRFWTVILRRGAAGPIVVRAGDQSMEMLTTPAFIQLPYGVSRDRRDLLQLLDQEAQLISAREEAMADVAAEIGLTETGEPEEEEKKPEQDEENGEEDEDT